MRLKLILWTYRAVHLAGFHPFNEVEEEDGWIVARCVWCNKSLKMRKLPRPMPYPVSKVKQKEVNDVPT